MSQLRPIQSVGGDVKPAVLAAYQLLRVAPWAPADEARRAYRALVREQHPDLHACNPRRRHEQMVQLNRAIEIVSNR